LFFLVIFFLVISSLEFLDERFLSTCARETLINEWDAYGLREVKGAFLGLGTSRGREIEEIWDSCRREPMGFMILGCEGNVRGTLLLWIPSPSSGVS
jgi:hypothetical protein